MVNNVYNQLGNTSFIEFVRDIKVLYPPYMRIIKIKKYCEHVNTNGPPDAAHLLKDITPKPPSCLCKWGHKPTSP